MKETTAYPSNTSFKVSPASEAKDQIEALYLETRGLDPAQLDNLRRISVEIVNKIKNNWSMYMDNRYPDEMELRDTAAMNLLFLDRDSFEIIDAYFTPESLTQEISRYVKGLHLTDLIEEYQNNDPDKNRQGRIICEFRPNMIIVDGESEIFSLAEPIVQQVADKATKGDTDEAAKILSIYQRIKYISHEIIHAYSCNSLPLDFQEMGVRFYEYIIVYNILHMYIENEDLKSIRNIYQGLIDRFGADVHRVFFDGQISQEKRSKIVKAGLQELKAKKINPRESI